MIDPESVLADLELDDPSFNLEWKPTRFFE